MTTLETPKTRKSPTTRSMKSSSKRDMEAVPMSPVELGISPNQPSAKKSRLRKEIENKENTIKEITSQDAKQLERVDKRKKMLEPSASFVAEQRTRRMEEKHAQGLNQRRSTLQVLRQKSFMTPKVPSKDGSGSRKNSPRPISEGEKPVMQRLDEETLKKYRQEWEKEIEKARTEVEDKNKALESELQRLREEMRQRDLSVHTVPATFPEASSHPSTSTASTRQSSKSPRTRSPKHRSPKRSPKPAPKTQAERQREQEEAIDLKVKTRKQEMKEKEEADREEKTQRDHLEKELAPGVNRRFRGKSYLQLCNEFCPKSRLQATPEKDNVRRTLRRAMAMYHPDRSSHLPTLRERVEAELIFQGLKNAYDEVVRMCAQGGR